MPTRHPSRLTATLVVTALRQAWVELARTHKARVNVGDVDHRVGARYRQLTRHRITRFGIKVRVRGWGRVGLEVGVGLEVDLLASLTNHRRRDRFRDRLRCYRRCHRHHDHHRY